MVQESEGGVFISTKDIYDEIKLMRGEVQRAADAIVESREDLRDHEHRLRSLERWKYGLSVTAATGVIALVTQIFHIAPTK